MFSAVAVVVPNLTQTFQFDTCTLSIPTTPDTFRFKNSYDGLFTFTGFTISKHI
ncbi:hypothetical protein Hanom_Chr15g01402661 [Helianthus anomalus]